MTLYKKYLAVIIFGLLSTELIPNPSRHSAEGLIPQGERQENVARGEEPSDLSTIATWATVEALAKDGRLEPQSENTVLPQFSYQYPIEIACGDQPGFPINSCIEPFAKFLYGYLDQSPLFDTAFVSDPIKVKQYLGKKKHDTRFIGWPFEVYTDDKVTLSCTFFDRGSENLLIVGEGFTNYREYLSPFAAMFPDYDVVLFDFRGHGYNPAWTTSLSKMTFDIEGSLVTFGKNEHLDVYAVVDGFKRFKTEVSGKPYKNVFGLGICYSSLIFLKSAAMWPGLFDKLILDGCWLSLPLFVEKVTKDLKAICNPQTGGWSDHWFFGTPITQNMTVWLAEKMWGIQFNQKISALDFANNVEKTKILFMHGKDDYMIRRHEFETLWNSITHVEKTVVLTSNPHVRNHWKQKELYRMIGELFFADQSQNDFINCLQDHNQCLEFYTKKMARAVAETYEDEEWVHDEYSGT